MNDIYLANIGEYKILNEDNSLGYVRDLNTCMCLILHRKKDSVIMHIEAYENDIILDDLYELLLDRNNLVKSVDIFLGPNSNNGNLSILLFMFSRINIVPNVYLAFKSLSNEVSVGYDYNTNEYFLVSMDKGNPMFEKKKLIKKLI